MKIYSSFLFFFFLFFSSFLSAVDEVQVCPCQESYWVKMYVSTVTKMRSMVNAIPEKTRKMVAYGVVKAESVIDTTKEFAVRVFYQVRNIFYSVSSWAHQNVD